MLPRTGVEKRNRSTFPAAVARAVIGEDRRRLARAAATAVAVGEDNAGEGGSDGSEVCVDGFSPFLL